MGRRVIRHPPRADPRAYVGKKRDRSNVWKPCELFHHYRPTAVCTPTLVMVSKACRRFDINVCVHIQPRRTPCARVVTHQTTGFQRFCPIESTDERYCKSPNATGSPRCVSNAHFLPSANTLISHTSFVFFLVHACRMVCAFPWRMSS